MWFSIDCTNKNGKYLLDLNATVRYSQYGSHGAPGTILAECLNPLTFTLLHLFFSENSYRCSLFASLHEPINSLQRILYSKI
jgi:hypothetical protein